jgi:hypothetical protein
MIVGFNAGDPALQSVLVNLSDDLPITDTSAGQLFESFQEITFRQVNTALIAQRFYTVQPDSFDQLVLITDFDLLGAPFGAFFQSVKNEVSGLRLRNFDNSSFFGSDGRLQGFLHMNWVNFWPSLAVNNIWLDVMGQEAEHEWAAFVFFENNGQESDLLLGRGLAHWSFFLDTDGSVMEGNGWLDSDNGSFTTVRAFDNYSLLDHYLMGLRPPAEIPPFFFVDIPGVTLGQRSTFPQTGVSVVGLRRDVTIDEIIAAEGPRIPSYQDAQKVFRQGYIYLVRQGETPLQQNLDKADSFRAAWSDYFSDRTDGRGVMQTQLGPDLPVATVEGDVTSALDGSIVSNLEARLFEKNLTQQIYDGGHYAFRMLADSNSPADLPVTIVLQAFPFLPDTFQINTVFGATLQQNRTLTPFPQSALQGTVQDANGSGVRAKLTLFVSSDMTEDFTITDSSDAQGNFAFEDIFVSLPPTIVYEKLLVEPEIPFASKTFANIAVNEGSPTVFDVTVERADVFVVNDDPNGAFEEFYRSALDNLGVNSFVWTQTQRGLAPVSFVSLFNTNTLIWYTGTAAGEAVLTEAERDSLAAHLDRGGKVFLTGQNIAESLDGSDFLTNRVHVSFVRNIIDFRLHGVQDDPVGNGLITIFTAGAGGADNQTSRDLLQPDAIAKTSVVYDTTTGTVAGVRVEDATNGSKLVFFGFGFEAITTGAAPDPSFSSRTDVMSNILDWFSSVTSVAESNLPNTIKEFELLPNYPNPFNGQTVIRYSIPSQVSSTQVTIKIFNIVGQEVRTLVNEQSASPGEYRVRWDGRDDSGVPMATGVYLYKMTAENFQEVRKLLFIR